jgi:hypothetical protein
VNNAVANVPRGAGYLKEILNGDKTRLSKFKLRIEDPPRRKHMVFLGGSVLADIMKVGWRVVRESDCRHDARAIADTMRERLPTRCESDSFPNAPPRSGQTLPPPAHPRHPRHPHHPHHLPNAKRT